MRKPVLEQLADQGIHGDKSRIARLERDNAALLAACIEFLRQTVPCPEDRTGRKSDLRAQMERVVSQAQQPQESESEE